MDGRKGHRALHAPLSVLFWSEVFKLLALPLVLLQILVWGAGCIVESSLARPCPRVSVIGAPRGVVRLVQGVPKNAM